MPRKNHREIGRALPGLVEAIKRQIAQELGMDPAQMGRVTIELRGNFGNGQKSLELIEGAGTDEDHLYTLVPYPMQGHKAGRLRTVQTRTGPTGTETWVTT